MAIFSISIFNRSFTHCRVQPCLFTQSLKSFTNFTFLTFSYSDSELEELTKFLTFSASTCSGDSCRKDLFELLELYSLEKLSSRGQTFSFWSGTYVDDKFDSEVCSIRRVDKARTAFRLFLQRFFLKSFETNIKIFRNTLIYLI